MNIYEKLQHCRVELQHEKIKKSGKNTFSNYDYFELGDFLPKINELFKEHKLFAAISFEKEIATMIIIDSEMPGDQLVFTSPMSEAQLKGCHPVQNLGAVETYQRRYLYMTALEIVDQDALEPVTGKPETKQNQQPPKQGYKLSDGQVNRAYAIAKSKGYGTEAVNKAAHDKYKKGIADFSRTEYDEFIKQLEAMPAKT